MDEEAQTGLRNKRINLFQILIIIISIVCSYFLWTEKAVRNPYFGIVGPGLIIVYGIQIISIFLSFSIYYFGITKFQKQKLATLTAIFINILVGIVLRWLIP